MAVAFFLYCVMTGFVAAILLPISGIFYDMLDALPCTYAGILIVSLMIIGILFGWILAPSLLIYKLCKEFGDAKQAIKNVIKDRL